MKAQTGFDLVVITVASPTIVSAAGVAGLSATFMSGALTAILVVFYRAITKESP